MDISHIDIEITLKKFTEEGESDPYKTVFGRKFRIDASFGFGLLDESVFQFIHNMVDKMILELKKFMED